MGIFQINVTKLFEKRNYCVLSSLILRNKDSQIVQEAVEALNKLAESDAERRKNEWSIEKYSSEIAEIDKLDEDRKAKIARAVSILKEEKRDKIKEYIYSWSGNPKDIMVDIVDEMWKLAEEIGIEQVFLKISKVVGDDENLILYVPNRDIRWHAIKRYAIIVTNKKLIYYYVQHAKKSSGFLHDIICMNYDDINEIKIGKMSGSRIIDKENRTIEFATNPAEQKMVAHLKERIPDKFK